MNETEWLSCIDPMPMLSFLLTDREVSKQKVRLFTLACCRRVAHLLPTKARTALETFEAFADWQVNPADAQDALDEVRALRGRIEARAEGAWTRAVLRPHSYYKPTEEDRELVAALYALRGLQETLEPFPEAVAEQCRCAMRHHKGSQAEPVEAMYQANFLRDIFGCLPFRDVRTEPAWLAWNDSTVCRLAEVIYEERRLEDLPILADALEDSGCGDEAILSHCRGPGPHARGCWVLDLLLGRS